MTDGLTANIYPTREPPPFPSLGDVESNAHVAYCFFFFSSKPSFWSMNFKFQSQTMKLHNTIKQEWYVHPIARMVHLKCIISKLFWSINFWTFKCSQKLLMNGIKLESEAPTQEQIAHQQDITYKVKDRCKFVKCCGWINWLYFPHFGHFFCFFSLKTLPKIEFKTSDNSIKPIKSHWLGKAARSVCRKWNMM